MTDEIERSIRDEVMTLESNGSLWVLAEDYRALLARAEAAEAERDEWHSDFRALEKAVVGDTGLSAMTVALQARKYRPRAEAAEAKLAAARDTIEGLISEAVGMADGTDEAQYIERRLRACIDADAPARPAPVTAGDGPLDPDMPEQEMRLHMGEMTAQEVRAARAAIRWANSRAALRALAGEKGDG